VVYLVADQQVPGESFAVKVLKEELQPAALMAWPVRRCARSARMRFTCIPMTQVSTSGLCFPCDDGALRVSLLHGPDAERPNALDPAVLAAFARSAEATAQVGTIGSAGRI
jgi:hypothetical protein